MPNPPALKVLTQDSRSCPSRPATRPKQVRPIIVSAGGIVRAAHLPAYEKAGFRLSASWIKRGPKLQNSHRAWHSSYFSSVTEPCALLHRTPLSMWQFPLSACPHPSAVPLGATVLMQKPWETLPRGRIIRDLCRIKDSSRRNTSRSATLQQQPRRHGSLANGGFLGEIHDIEVKQDLTRRGISGPFATDRAEILSQHHYFDLIARGWATRKASWRAR